MIQSTIVDCSIFKDTLVRVSKKIYDLESMSLKVAPEVCQISNGHHTGTKKEILQINKKRVTVLRCNPLIYMVGTEGFEPSTSYTPCKRATKLRYAPKACHCKDFEWLV